jgi:hypothetical protein
MKKIGSIREPTQQKVCKISTEQLVYFSFQKIKWKIAKTMLPNRKNLIAMTRIFMVRTSSAVNGSLDN